MLPARLQNPPCFAVKILRQNFNTRFLVIPAIKSRDDTRYSGSRGQAAGWQILPRNDRGCDCNETLVGVNEAA